MPYPNSFNPVTPQQQFQNFFNPMMQQQFQQQIPVQQNISTGKIVDSVDMVKFADIPMDGNSYFFPKADGTEIYSKRWLANGQTEINTYAKVDINQIEEKKQTFENTLFEKIDMINERIDRLEKGLGKTTRTKEA